MRRLDIPKACTPQYSTCDARLTGHYPIGLRNTFGKYNHLFQGFLFGVLSTASLLAGFYILLYPLPYNPLSASETFSPLASFIRLYSSKVIAPFLDSAIFFSARSRSMSA